MIVDSKVNLQSQMQDMFRRSNYLRQPAESSSRRWFRFPISHHGINQAAGYLTIACSRQPIAPQFLDAAAIFVIALSCRSSLIARAMPRPTLLNSHNALLTTVVLLLQLTTPPAAAVTVAANSPGLYRNYYNAGFASTPITSLPNYAALSPANSTFVSGTTGNFANPQLYSADTYCGGVYQGYLYTTGSYATYIVGVQSKDGFQLTIDGASISSNSKPCLAASNTSFGQHIPQCHLAMVCVSLLEACVTLQALRAAQCQLHASIWHQAGTI